jgi:imidazolonepropionase-like amidohydrolase
VTDAHFAAMRARDMAWVPTLMPGGSDAACEFAAAMGFSTGTREWMRATLDAQPAAVARADAAGVTVLAGTDAGQGPHGAIVDQITMLADAGMPVTAASGAASWTARRWLGLACLESGAPADLVLYEADPRTDLDVLRRPALIVMDGQVIESNANFGQACWLATSRRPAGIWTRRCRSHRHVPGPVSRRPRSRCSVTSPWPPVIL